MNKLVRRASFALPFAALVSAVVLPACGGSVSQEECNAVHTGDTLEIVEGRLGSAASKTPSNGFVVARFEGERDGKTICCTVTFNGEEDKSITTSPAVYNGDCK